MKRILKAGIAALTLTAVTAGAVLPADAQPRRGHYDNRHYNYRYDRHDNTGAAIAGGILGLALGAAIVGSSSHSQPVYSSRYAYDYGYNPYYGPSYDPYYGRRICERNIRTYDRWGRPMIVRQQYPC